MKTLAIFAAAIFCTTVCHADFQMQNAAGTVSSSGQFIVTGGERVSELATLPMIVTNSDFVRLQPAFLAISAERAKESFRRQLGISPSAPWSGKIFLAVHPARSADEDVTIIATPFVGVWNYRLELPDVISRQRLARAMTGVLLLEFANRTAQSHTAEVPEWLVDGLSQQLYTPGSAGDFLSIPNKSVRDIPVTKIDRIQRGVFDPLTQARQTLNQYPALTFQQLSWPDNSQTTGADGGAYRASALLFVSSLLNLKNGAVDLQTMLQTLPQVYNWQTAFTQSFQEYFQTPLDVEKWWALQVVNFAAPDPGPQWTPAVSLQKLDEMLSVPVDIRADSNSLPSHAEISLQAVIRNFDSAQRMPILQTKLRDFETARFRVATPFAALTEGYRMVLKDYLNSQDTFISSSKVESETLKKLDSLDAQRRQIEEKDDQSALAPSAANANAP